MHQKNLPEISKKDINDLIKKIQVDANILNDNFDKLYDRNHELIDFLGKFTNGAESDLALQIGISTIYLLDKNGEIPSVKNEAIYDVLRNFGNKEPKDFVHYMKSYYTKHNKQFGRFLNKYLTKKNIKAGFNVYITASFAYLTLDRQLEIDYQKKKTLQKIIEEQKSKEKPLTPDINELKKELETVLFLEQYERAAELRDQIKELEKKK